MVVIHDDQEFFHGGIRLLWVFAVILTAEPGPGCGDKSNPV
jgi:hypothetical protein